MASFNEQQGNGLFPKKENNFGNNGSQSLQTPNPIEGSNDEQHGANQAVQPFHPPNGGHVISPTMMGGSFSAPFPNGTHNLIPLHLQNMAYNGVPSFQQQQQAFSPALIHPGIPPSIPFQIQPSPPPPEPILTVQDRPMVPPVYNGVHPNYPGVRMISSAPPLFTVENFLSPAECEHLINSASDAFGPAPVVGKGAGEVSPSRTSSTCYLAREDLPHIMQKVHLLTGKPVDHCELPQVGRYLPSQQYLQHFDAFDLSNDDGRRFASNGGQRTVTVLIYLNDVEQGGHTAFPALNIEVKPQRGMALVFFPATIDGLLDKSALHAALPAIDVKYVSQVWIRQSVYVGQPSKRIPPPPFSPPVPVSQFHFASSG